MGTALGASVRGLLTLESHNAGAANKGVTAELQLHPLGVSHLLPISETLWMLGQKPSGSHRHPERGLVFGLGAGWAPMGGSTRALGTHAPCPERPWALERRLPN